jgi:hypothetical protein
VIIKMTADFRVAIDGFSVTLWPVDSIHECDDQLGGDLIAAGKAELLNPNMESAAKRRGRPPKDAL